MKKKLFNQIAFMELASARADDLGVNYKEIAEFAGQEKENSGQSWSRWRKDTQPLTVEQMCAICKRLKLPAGFAAFAAFGIAPRNEDERQEWDKAAMFTQTPKEVPAVDLREEDPKHAAQKKSQTS